MIYFCADDYGIAKECNDRMEECLAKGALNKVSVLPNGECPDFKERLSGYNAKISLHINLVEGYPLSSAQEIAPLLNEQGTFKYSFIGLLFHSLSPKRKALEKAIYKEIQKQIVYWKHQMGDTHVSIDSHQHVIMIPLIFKTLMRVIAQEGLQVDYIRVPAEPLSPYLLNPSLYSAYSLSGLAKQWLLKFLFIFNYGKLKKSGIEYAYFMGAMFSGHVTEDKIQKLLPRYLKIAEKNGKNIEVGLHPGYLAENGKLMDGCRTSFEKFYFSPWRQKEYDALMNLKNITNITKEGLENALY